MIEVDFEAVLELLDAQPDEVIHSLVVITAYAVDLSRASP